MKRNRRSHLLVGTVLAMVFLTSCATVNVQPLETVASLDLDRYLGSWYEVARFQHQFERNLVGVKADYSLRPDGRVQVVNSGLRKTLEGNLTSVKAVAWRPDDSVPGALKVRFFGLFTSDYLVFGLDEENYQWALVGNNNRNFLWFLSRTPKVSEELLQKMKQLAVNQGYDLEGLFLVPQIER